VCAPASPCHASLLPIVLVSILALGFCRCYRYSGYCHPGRPELLLPALCHCPGRAKIVAAVCNRSEQEVNERQITPPCPPHVPANDCTANAEGFRVGVSRWVIVAVVVLCIDERKRCGQTANCSKIQDTATLDRTIESLAQSHQV
jgi:hypothetical protein